MSQAHEQIMAMHEPKLRDLLCQGMFFKNHATCCLTTLPPQTPHKQCFHRCKRAYGSHPIAKRHPLNTYPKQVCLKESKSRHHGICRTNPDSPPTRHIIHYPQSPSHEEMTNNARNKEPLNERNSMQKFVKQEGHTFDPNNRPQSTQISQRHRPRTLYQPI